ncbi:MAG: glycoside hydrolase family 2 TIM barrel-domain containing protein [Rikenellaceae bacterium]
MKITKLYAIALMVLCAIVPSAAQELFNSGWSFHRIDDTSEVQDAYSNEDFDAATWERVALPHTANIEPLTVNDQWQGLCWYRKNFDIKNYSADKIYLFEFDGAMNQTTIWINGAEVKRAQGGYLPIVFDATPYLKAEGNTMAVRLNNTDNPVTGPKPLAILDFNMYGGIYRNVWLIEKSKTHITNSILADRTASGGIFVSFPKVAKEKSIVKIQTHVANEDSKSKTLRVKYDIYDGESLVVSHECKPQKLATYANSEFVANIAMEQPKLWSPASPNLYRAEVSLYDGEELLDKEETTFGIRVVTFKNNQMYVNGEKTYLRGVNRHQEYPFIGYALSDNAQYRDAKRIKDAGFDYVRLSHYPQSPAFMKACDELGLFVADAILGWQYYAENDDFKNHAYESARNLIRRDRNHPCVLAWEVSLNETQMPVPFMQVLHNIVHQEYPGENVYSCGWMDDVYDIYFQARQHRIKYPDHVSDHKPYMVSEYGDWEYYSNNAGLNQHQHSKEKRLELSSRQFRSNGEARLIQQAYNLQESHNDNMMTHATGDSYWVMYDYNRGYHDEIEASGIMDIFRLPKFGYDFYASQKSPEASVVLKIASYWDENSPIDVRVFSNCDEVKLYLNNKLVASQTPDKNKISTKLSHAPFTFKVGEFAAGTLRAEGYIDGKKVASTEVTTASAPKQLKIWIDESGRQAEAGCKDAIFLYVAAADKKGNICYSYTDPIEIEVDDKIIIVNPNEIITEAGIATALLQIRDVSGTATVKATSGKSLKGEYKFEIK